MLPLDENLVQPQGDSVDEILDTLIMRQALDKLPEAQRDVLRLALDGFTQLFGWRESSWELRVATGLLFGLASAWLVLPRLDSSFGLDAAPRQYAPAHAACEPLPHPSAQG